MSKILNGQINQQNVGDLQGKLYNSFNCDLTYNQGKISISPVTILTTDSRDASTPQDVPVGFKYFDSCYFTVAGTKVFKNAGTPVGSFVQDGSAGSPTTCSSDYSDLEVFGDTLAVSSASALYTKASAGGAGTGAYTSRRSFGSSTDYHALCVYKDRAYWLDANQPPRIYSMDTAFSVSTSGSYTMQLPSEYVVTWMRAYSNGIFIGTIHRFGGEGLVFDWDGVTANTWKRAYTVKSQGALAGFVSGDVPYIVNSNSELREFDGAGFKYLGRLPIKRNLLYRATNTLNTNRFIHPNGLGLIDSNLSMLINSRDNNTTTVEYNENIHSGIWEYTEQNGLYHKHSLSYRTRPDQAGSITDYGQIAVSRIGGFIETPDLLGTSETLKGNFLAGANVYIDSAGNTISGVWTDNYYDTVEKAGFFSTVKIPSEHVEEMFNKITAIYSPYAGMSFVVKYRTEAGENSIFNATWVSGASLTTTQSVTNGDELTVIQGRGSGRVAHVSNVTGSTTYTVTLDETITGVSTGSTFVARKENWKKLGTINNANRKFQIIPISQPDTAIEIKVAMLGTSEVTLDELVLDNKLNQ